METRLGRIEVALGLGLGVLFLSAASAPLEARAAGGPSSESVIYFVADGMRQDLITELGTKKSFPALNGLLKKGASASQGGMLTQAPATTGAGWSSLATGAWPGVTGVTNDFFHINGATFANRTAASDAGVLDAETLAQAAERGGRRVAQIEWSGGRGGNIDGPTVDSRSSFSGRGVTTNFISTDDQAAFVASLGLQFDHPSGFGGQPAFSGAAAAAATGWTNVPLSERGGRQMRLRVLDAGVDKYGLNVFIYDSSGNGVVDYDRVLLSPTKNGDDTVADIGKGEWAEIKLKIVGGPQAGLTAAYLIKLEELTSDFSRVRLFHTAVSRANASWPNWPGEPGFVGDFEEYVAKTFPAATSADFAVLQAGIVSEQTYLDQALRWEIAYRPLIEYIIGRYRPHLVMAGYPLIEEFSRQFLGLITNQLPGGIPNPAYDDLKVDGTPDGRVDARRDFLRRAYQGADSTLALIQSRMPKKTTSFVASEHGFGPQFVAIDASKVLVDLGLLSRPQTANCRTATGETLGRAKACWSGGSVQIYLNLAGRDPVGGGFTQVPAANEAAAIAFIRARFETLVDPNDWNHDGQPEGWRVIDRMFSKAEARYIPNGAGSTADMAHPTRTGDLVVFAAPPYQFESATPGTQFARSFSFGAHGFMPDLQALDASLNMRAAFLAGGNGIGKAALGDLRTIDIAPTIAYLLRIPLPQHAQGEVRLELLKGGKGLRLLPILGLNDFHGQLDPTTLLMDGLNVSVGGAARLATLFDEEGEPFSDRPLLFAAGDNVGASPPASALLEDMPAIDVESAWGLNATALGHHEFDYGLDRLLAQQVRARSPFLGANIVEAASGQSPAWVEPSQVFDYGKLKVGVIGIALERTPELVAPGNTADLSFLPAIETIQTESERLRRMGVNVQIVLIHEGTSAGSNRVDGDPAVPWTGPIVPIVEAIQDTTVDVVFAGHTQRISNTRVGRILVLEGLNAGISYSLAQLLIRGSDVEWAGGASRVAKNLGVAGRTDVQQIVSDATLSAFLAINLAIGTQQFDILRAPTRLFESAMGNLVADAMRYRYPGVDGALMNSGPLRADLPCNPPSAGEAACAITWGEAFAVLPLANRSVIVTLTGAQLETALLNGVSPFCNAAITTGRFPQVAGIAVSFACTGITPVLTGLWLAPNGPGGTLTPIGPADEVRLVTNDFMFAGGDGYGVLAQGTDALVPGDDLLHILIDSIGANSPVGPVVEGRVDGP